VDSSIRASAFAGLGAFALSTIVAVFSRVPFGALLLRALLSGLGFAALTFGGLWLLRRFIPELFDETAAASVSGADGTLGSVVDIVLQEDDAELGDARPAQALDLSLRDTAPYEVPHGEAPRRDAPLNDAIRGDTTRTEPFEVLPAGTLVPGELEREVADLRSDALVSSDPTDSGSGSRSLPRPSVALDELDTLPDLDGFSDSFSEGIGGEPGYGAGPAGDGSRMMGPSESMPTAGSPDSGHDPVVLAKAVQTLLRRDQKGQ
jgi:hypothetical protein